MLIESQANRIFKDLVKNYASSIGFEYENNGKNNSDPPFLKKINPRGFEIIGDLYLEFYNRNLLMNGGCSKRFDDIEKIWLKHYLRLNKVGNSFNENNLVTISSNAKRISDYVYDPNNRLSVLRIKERYNVEASTEGVKLLFEQLKSNIENVIIPFFRKFDSIDSLDNEMNSTPERYFECIHLFSGNGLIFKKMIVARLAENPNFEMVCSAMKDKIHTLEVESDTLTNLYLDVWNNLKIELQELKV